MHIYFERSGGFAGMKLRKELDTNSLPEAPALRLKKLVRESGFFDLPVKLESRAPGADRFNYRITIECEDRSHTVEATDAAVPATMRPLLELLAQLSRG